MAKAELKTKANTGSVSDFLNSIQQDSVKADSIAIVEIIKELSGEEPKMWGTSIVGFGQETLKYESGRELDWFKIGFSPRKANLTLYGLKQSQNWEDILARLGKCTTGKGCLYIKQLTDIDLTVLKELILKALASS